MGIITHLGLLRIRPSSRALGGKRIYPSLAETAISVFGGNGLSVGVGHKVPYVFRRTFFFVANLITVRIVRILSHMIHLSILKFFLQGIQHLALNVDIVKLFINGVLNKS